MSTEPRDPAYGTAREIAARDVAVSRTLVPENYHVVHRAFDALDALVKGGEITLDTLLGYLPGAEFMQVCVVCGEPSTSRGLYVSPETREVVAYGSCGGERCGPAAIADDLVLLPVVDS